LGYRTRYARLLAKTETTNTNKSSSPRQKQHKAEPKTTHPNQKRITQQKNNEQTTQTTQKHNNPTKPATTLPAATLRSRGGSKNTNHPTRQTDQIGIHHNR
jgi:hypothetical protein